MELPKNFESKTAEPEIYKKWEDSGYFNPDRLPETYNLEPKTFSIIMPPPNANEGSSETRLAAARLRGDRRMGQLVLGS